MILCHSVGMQNVIIIPVHLIRPREREATRVKLVNMRLYCELRIMYDCHISPLHDQVHVNVFFLSGCSAVQQSGQNFVLQFHISVILQHSFPQNDSKKRSEFAKTKDYLSAS